MNYATADGTATNARGDYTPTSGTLTFAPGETSKTVPVTVFPTTRHSVYDELSLVLSSPSGATLGDGVGNVKLTSRVGRIAISVLDTPVVRSASTGGAAVVTVSLSVAPAAGESVTVNVATANGTAIAGVDYGALGSTAVTFGPGEMTKTVTISVASRPVGTPKRAFTLALSGASANAYIADSAATIDLVGP